MNSAEYGSLTQEIDELRTWDIGKLRKELDETKGLLKVVIASTLIYLFLDSILPQQSTPSE